MSARWSVEAPDDADHLPLDLDVARVDRLHLTVRRLQPANGEMQPIYARDVQIQGKVIGVIRRFD